MYATHSISRFLLALLCLGIPLVVSSPFPRPGRITTGTTADKAKVHHNLQHPHIPQPPVLAHAIPGGPNFHRMGYIVADTAHQQGMTQSLLHGYVQASASSTKPSDKYDVHVIHNKGSNHPERIYFHSTPPGFATHHGQNMQHFVQSPMTPPYKDPANMGRGENAEVERRNKIFLRAVHETKTVSAGNDKHSIFSRDRAGRHGKSLVGTVSVHESHQRSMDPVTLQLYAKAIRTHLGFQEKDTTVFVSHQKGHGRLHFLAFREDQQDMYRTEHEYSTRQELTVHEKGRINAHLAKTDDPYSGKSITGDADMTFKGKIPVHPDHSTGQLSRAELDLYAAHAKKRLEALHGTTISAVAAVHKAGDPDVHFHTPPRGSENTRLADKPDFPQFNEALQKAGHVSAFTGKPWYHAEFAALNDSLVEKKRAHKEGSFDFNGAIAGYTIGVAGQGEEPCKPCRDSLVQLPVRFKGMEFDTKPGIRRAL